MHLQDSHIHLLQQIARDACASIMEVYVSDDHGVSDKDDTSPLTRADTASHHTIMQGLQHHFPTIPVMSEEGASIAYEDRKNRDYFWCVDPLDGTKEFIKRNGEFCVCIALIHKDTPVFGLIAAPVTGDLYRGGKEYGAYKSSQGTIHDLRMSTPESTDTVLLVGSRSHQSDEDKQFAQQFLDQGKQTLMVSTGSALKFCAVAEGLADFYPRFKPTMERDTAAGQAILEGMGGSVIDQATQSPMHYNKKKLRNNSFVAMSTSV